MGNASEEVQRHADFVTSGVDDEGIVHALKQGYSVNSIKLAN